MTIDATDLSHVIIDGKDQGHFMDAAHNFPLRRAEIKAAVDIRLLEQDQTTLALRQTAARQVLAAQAEKDAAIAEADAAIAVLGTKEEAQAIIKAQQIAQMETTIAMANARIAELKK